MMDAENAREEDKINMAKAAYLLFGFVIGLTFHCGVTLLLAGQVDCGPETISVSEDARFSLVMTAGSQVADGALVRYQCQTHHGNANFPIVLDGVEPGQCSVSAELEDGRNVSAVFDLVGDAAVICFHGNADGCVSVFDVGTIQQIGS